MVTADLLLYICFHLYLTNFTEILSVNNKIANLHAKVKHASMSSVSFCGKNKQTNQKLAYHLSWKATGDKAIIGGGEVCSLLAQEVKQVSTLTKLHCETCGL